MATTPLAQAHQRKRRRSVSRMVGLWKTVITVLVLILCIMPPGASAAVLGIDFGTEWFTVALAKPGRPLDLVLNRDANRQTASVVTINGLERTFGSNAISIAPRFPEKTFMAVRNLLGVPFESDVAAAYRNQFPNEMVADAETGAIAFRYGAQENETISVQEIVAMQLRHAQQLVKESEGVVVRDAVLTVPSFFDRSQRQAMLEAAELAGLRTLALVNDGSAVALNYAMNREFAKPERHLFYDMGAGKTVATVARFSVRQESKSRRAKKSTVISVQSFASDAMLGGQEIDFVVREMLIGQFAAQAGVAAEEVRGSARAMSRLLKEAKRVKTILSANVEAVASVEGVHNGIDLRAHITRGELEAATAQLVSRIRTPVDDALRAANATIADIDSVVLVGGGSRVPFVQRALSDAFGAAKLSRNVNAEEACVMGAVFKGATLSSHFKVRDMRLRDAMAYAVRATYETPSGSLLGGTDQTIAYPYMEFGAVGARRVIREFRSTDLAIEFEAKRSGSGDSGVWNKLVSARIGGVSKAASKLKAKYVLSDRPEVKVAVQTNELGEFEVLKAEALFNVTNPGYTQYVADLAAWEEESASIDDEATKTQAAAAADDDSSSSDATTTTKAKAKPTLRPRPIAQPEVITEIVPLSLDVETHGLAKMSSASLERSRDLLQRMDADDTARIARHSTSNNLESLVYQLRDMAEDDDAIEVTSESQRRALEDAVSAAAEWLEDNVESAPLDEIEAQIASLKALEAPITYRRTQRAKRAGHIDVLRSAVAQAEGLVSMYRAEYSAEELGPVMEQLVGLEDALDETVQWLDATTAQQDALQPYEEPVLTTEEMGRRAAEIEKSLTDLVAQQVKRIVASATNKQSTTEPTAEADDNKGNGGGHEEL